MSEFLKDVLVAIVLFVRGVARILRRLATLLRWRWLRPRRSHMQLPVKQDSAEALFLSLLSPENRESFARSRQIRIRGSEGGEFVMFYGFAGIVAEVTTRGHRSWCAYPRDYCHYYVLQESYVSMISQMLMIETDEALYRRTAYA